MRFLSVCSGIEAASVAWGPLGWKAAGFSEIEPFPCAVLAHHYPDVPNHGDMTKWKEWNIEKGSVDVVCGGTPCQSFSVAGLRKGLDDPRGNLMLVFLAILDAVRPRWVVWENVPGVLSSNGGKDFGTFLGGLGELGYGFAYRVLDAQFIRVDGFERAVPQRRRRVFVVGHLGSWQRAAAVLLEQNSLCGNPAPRRKAGQGFTRDTAPSLTASGRGVERAGETRGQDPVIAVGHRMQAFGEYIDDDTASAMKARDYKDATDLVTCAEVSPCMTAGGAPFERTGNERTECDAIVAIRTAQTGSNGCGIDESGASYTLDLANGQAVAIGPGGEDVGYSLRATPSHFGDKGDGGMNCSVAVAFNGDQSAQTRSMGESEEHSPTLRADGLVHVQKGMSVRRLTPVECERLMGFPDNYTAIPWRGKDAENCPDGPRYKALGNSWAVNCARWVGTRIQMVEDIFQPLETRPMKNDFVGNDFEKLPTLGKTEGAAA